MSRRTQRYRSVDYEAPTQPDVVPPPNHPKNGRGWGGVSTRTPVQRLNQTSKRSEPLAAPLFYGDEEEDCVPGWEGPPLKRRATAFSRASVETRTEGRLLVDRPVEPIRPHSRGWGWGILGAILFLSIYLFLTGVLFPWVRGIEDRWQYGQSGVYRMNAYLGQGDSQSDPSELLAYRSHNLVIVDIVEDSRVRSFPLTFATTGLTSDIVTLEVRDMNGDSKPDILVHVGGLTVVMWSNGSGYQGTKP